MAVYADVSELPASEYLPPSAPAPAPAPISAPAPSPEYLPPVSGPVDQVEPAHELTPEGYKYKSHRARRIRYRRRRV